MGSVTRFCANPSLEHWTAVKRILQYLKGTVSLGLYTKGVVQLNALDTQVQIGREIL